MKYRQADVCEPTKGPNPRMSTGSHSTAILQLTSPAVRWKQGRTRLNKRRHLRRSKEEVRELCAVLCKWSLRNWLPPAERSGCLRLIAVGTSSVDGQKVNCPLCACAARHMWASIFVWLALPV